MKTIKCIFIIIVVMLIGVVCISCKGLENKETILLASNTLVSFSDLAETKSTEGNSNTENSDSDKIYSSEPAAPSHNEVFSKPDTALVRPSETSSSSNEQSTSSIKPNISERSAIEGFSIANEMEIPIGTRKQFGICVYPTDALGRENIIVSIDKTDIAKIIPISDGIGSCVIEGLTAGKCTLTVDAGNGVTSQCDITVK